MPATKTLIISTNDLEAEAIAARAKKLGFVPVDLGLGWGQRLDPLDERLAPDGLGRLVVMVECPAPAFEAHLRARGHIVEVIDHHLYIDGRGDRLDRRRARSSLEQFVGLYGKGEGLTEKERLIAANDRGFWPALLAITGRTAEGIARARRMRECDLALRQHADALLDEAIRWVGDALARSATADSPIAILGCGRGDKGDPELVLARAPDRLRAVLADALWLVHLRGLGERAPAGCWFGREHGTRPLELVLLFEADDGHLTQLEYSGPGERQALLDELVDRLLGDGSDLGRLRLWAGGSQTVCFLGADPGEAGETELRALADRLVDLCLGGNRPLLKWRSSFLQVLRYEGEANAEAARSGTFDDEPAGEPERNYIVDYLAHFLTPTRDEQRQELHDGRIARDSLMVRSYACAGRPEDAGRLPRLRVEWPGGRLIERLLAGIKVHFLHGGLVILEWQFQDGWPGFDGKSRLVDALLRRAHLLQAAREACISAFAPDPPAEPYPTLPPPTRYSPGVDCMAELLDFNDAARQCYSSFWSPSLRKTISLIQPDGEVSPAGSLEFGIGTQASARQPAFWFRDLVALALKPFELDPDKVELVLDERARVLTTAGLAGNRPDLEAAAPEQDVLFQRLATVEPFGPRHFYDPDFLAGEHARIAYRRFATSPTYPGSSALHGITDQSLVLMGFGWFAANVSIKHVACQYQRLFLTGLLYSSTFHELSHELGRLARQRIGLTRDLAALDKAIDRARRRCRWAWRKRRARSKLLRRIEHHGAEIGRIRERFTGFANGLWFDEVSTQIQGREMFRMMTAELGVRAQYDEITAEIERSDALEREDAARRAEQRRDEIGVLGATFGTFVAAATFGVGEDSSWLVWTVTLLAALLAPTLVLAMLRLQPPRHALIDVLHLWASYAVRALETITGPLGDCRRPPDA